MATAVAKADIEQSNGASHDRLDRFSLIARRPLRQDANCRGDMLQRRRRNSIDTAHRGV